MASHSDFNPSSKHEAELKMYKKITEKKKNEANEILSTSKRLKTETEKRVAFQKKEIQELQKLIEKMTHSEELKLLTYAAQSDSVSFGDINMEIRDRQNELSQLKNEKEQQEEILKNIKTNITKYQKNFDESKQYICEKESEFLYNEKIKNYSVWQDGAWKRPCGISLTVMQRLENLENGIISQKEAQFCYQNRTVL